jgi:truncated hemoglobin YjbI
VATIKLILKKFYEELLNRTWAKKMFVNVDMEKLLLHQIQFVSFAMGKPESEFDDQRLKKGHAGLKITQEQYEETILILIKVLTDFKV